MNKSISLYNSKDRKLNLKLCLSRNATITTRRCIDAYNILNLQDQNLIWVQLNKRTSGVIRNKYWSHQTNLTHRVNLSVAIGTYIYKWAKRYSIPFLISFKWPTLLEYRKSFHKIEKMVYLFAKSTRRWERLN